MFKAFASSSGQFHHLTYSELEKFLMIQLRQAIPEEYLYHPYFDCRNFIKHIAFSPEEDSQTTFEELFDKFGWTLQCELHCIEGLPAKKDVVVNRRHHFFSQEVEKTTVKCVVYTLKIELEVTTPSNNHFYFHISFANGTMDEKINDAKTQWRNIDERDLVISTEPRACCVLQ